MRNFFGNLKNSLRRMMYGRHGNDALNKALLGVVFALIVLNLFLKNKLVALFEIIGLVYIYFRAFSKNNAARFRENNWYLNNIQNKITRLVSRDRKNYAYFKCPNCGTELKAPKGKGLIRVTCRSCGEVFEKRV